MSTRPLSPGPGSLLRGAAVQGRVIGALLMRELHTRYGRENVGYLWMIGEPMILATVVGVFHINNHTEYGSDIKPLPFAVLGYTVFIMFRSICNRSDGALEGNASLLYHRMVSILDIVLSRCLLEAAGTIATLTTLLFLLTVLGFAGPPERPLYLFAALAYIFWLSFGHSLVIVAISHDNRTIGRLVHPYSYFQIPLSAAFFQVGWLPQPYRYYLEWLPLPSIFEMARYGQFETASPDHIHWIYLTGCCLVLNWIGLVALKLVRQHVHVR